jgi:hypothetical protein
MASNFAVMFATVIGEAAGRSKGYGIVELTTCKDCIACRALSFHVASCQH